MQKVDITIDALEQKDGSFIIVLPGSGTYLINGVSKKVDYSSAKTIITSDKCPDEIYSIQENSVIVKYVNRDDTNIFISVDDYDSHCLSLLKNRVNTTDEDGDTVYSWKNIDEEFEYKKYIAKWIAVYQKINVVNQTYTVTKKKKIYSDNPYFIPVNHIGGNITDNLFQYSRFSAARQHFTDSLTQKGYVQSSNTNVKNKTFDIPTHSQFEFAKINDKYVFKNDTGKRFNSFTDTYDKCLDVYNKDMKMIDDIIKENTIEKGEPIDKTKIIGILKSIESNVSGIEFKMVSRSKYYSTLEMIRKTINDIVNE